MLNPAAAPCLVWLVDTGCRDLAALNRLGGLTYDRLLPRGATIARRIAAHLVLSTTGTDASVAVRIDDVARTDQLPR